MEVVKYPEQEKWEELSKRPLIDFYEIEGKVTPVLQQVKIKGDEALRYYSKQFDGVEIDNFQVSEEEIKESVEFVPQELKEALKEAKHNIEVFHRAQYYIESPVETAKGIKCWRKSIPIEKVGLYIPGGTAPLFSTLLMLAVPAVVAGCDQIIVCTPPGKNGQVPPALLYVMHLLGLKKVYKLGGAQAIAAMAYGTRSIPSVYKIFGPGNQFVTAAKQLVNKEGISIDMPAGPSEVMVVADDSADPDFIAIDLLSQAEHGKDSQVVLVSDSEYLIKKVEYAIEIHIEKLPRKETARLVLENSKIILLEKTQIMDFVNEYAPEHLIISTENAGSMAEKVRNAGSVFIGNYTPESAGDYASGTNHTLPTNGFAKAFSGVSLDSFLKKITFQEISSEGLENLGNTLEIMAENESLRAHKLAVSMRRNKNH